MPMISTTKRHLEPIDRAPALQAALEDEGIRFTTERWGDHHRRFHVHEDDWERFMVVLERVMRADIFDEGESW